jgi:hypothetical protein
MAPPTATIQEVARILCGSKSTAEQILVAIDKMLERAVATRDFGSVVHDVWAGHTGPAVPILVRAIRELVVECQRSAEVLAAIAQRLEPALGDDLDEARLDPEDVLAKVGALIPLRSDVEPS